MPLIEIQSFINHVQKKHIRIEAMYFFSHIFLNMLEKNFSWFEYKYTISLSSKPFNAV